MIGPRIGGSQGARIGASIGVSSLGALSGVTQDATSLKFAPSSSSEWTIVKNATGIPGIPSNGWGCQVTSGNLTDFIGSVPLVVSGTPSFRQTIAGWTRKAVAITATTVQAFSVASGTGPNPATTSVAWLGYVTTPTTPGGNRNVVYPSGSATPVGIDHIVSGGKLMIRCGANTTNSVGGYSIAAVYPLLIVYNRTASSVSLYTDQEALKGTFAAVTDGTKGIGATQGSGDSSAKYLYLCAFSGSAAEMSSSHARSLLQALGWTIPW